MLISYLVCGNTIPHRPPPMVEHSGSFILLELLSIKLDHNDSCLCCRFMFAEQTLHALISALHSTTVLHHCTQVHSVLHHCTKCTQCYIIARKCTARPLWSSIVEAFLLPNSYKSLGWLVLVVLFYQNCVGTSSFYIIYKKII